VVDSEDAGKAKMKEKTSPKTATREELRSQIVILKK
jgi:hypothetical protein